MTLLVFTEKLVSASMNVTIMTSSPAAFHMSGPDSNFSDSIKDDFVESFVSSAIQNSHPTISEFA